VITVINDLHIGAKRVAGTTTESAAHLRENLLARLRSLLAEVKDPVIVINGDFFDTYSVSMLDWLEAYQALSDWLHAGEARALHLVAGNHDLSKNSTELSSFELLGHMLRLTYPGRVQYLCGANWIDEARGVYAISHVVNQAEFDLQLDRVPESARCLLLHCNFDSPFTEHADHSLNLPRPKAKELVERGVQIVIGHEHHPSSAFGNRLLIPGNQFPASVADCVTPQGRKVDSKHCVRLLENGAVELQETWRGDDDDGFIDFDWRELEGDTLRDAEDFAGFIRVSGRAGPEESADAIKRISRLRQRSDALVVANAVRVTASDGGGQELAESVEDVRKADVIQMVIDTLTPAQADVVRRLWANRGH
jgi:calcineurin-like phosphoesterase family protein